jgi:hypothetical protein
MKSKSTEYIRVPQVAKKAYQAPKLKVLGRVTNLTLKSGSATDGFGTFA